MNKSLPVQVQELEHKIDHLHHLVIEISKQLSRLTSGSTTHSEKSVSHSPGVETADESLSFSRIMFHKDVLLDDDEALPFWMLNSDQPVSADLQIRRLTAQLTAAYHRIAALEEQIMAQRLQS
jgi:hypothetical protein